MHNTISISEIKDVFNIDAVNNFASNQFTNLDFQEWILIFKDQISKVLERNSIVLVTKDEKEAESHYKFLKYFFNCSLFQTYEISPYADIYQPENSMFENFSALYKISQRVNQILITTQIGFIQKFINLSFFNNCKSLQVNEIYNQKELLNNLLELGFKRLDICDEPGSFSLKGEILDIYLYKQAYRISFFDELIEKIHPIDLTSNRSITTEEISKLQIPPMPLQLTKEEFRINLSENLKQFGPNQKELFLKRRSILNSLNSGYLFDNFPLYIPLFFKNPETIADICRNHHFKLLLTINDFNNEFLNLEKERITSFRNSELSILPEIELFYNFSDNFDFYANIISPISNIKNNLYEFTGIEHLTQLQNDISINSNHYERNLFLLKKILQMYSTNYSIFFNHTNLDNKEKFQNLIETISDDKITTINYISNPLKNSFINHNSKTVYISENDLFSGREKKIISRKVNHDLFAEQFSSLKEGDYVIHKDFGLGVFLGLTNIELAGAKSDFIIIKYKDDDKVYVPVYRLDLVQKYSESENEHQLADLKTKKFLAIKNKSKSTIKKLAFDLIKLQAEREIRKGYQFSPPDDLYNDFENTFPFEETVDQKKAIHDVLDDMTSNKPMDRLICGDVGFGKTEIAMRAAFKAVLDKKQVAILVPTTVLCLQHFNSFKKRFSNFPVNIQQFSRLTSNKDLPEILSNLREGKIDIIIGTHKLLSDKIVYHDLGLVIVDEEHRFGVSHKEKLKVLKSNIDFLTLTATPIPRTLQLSFLGIKDFSLIKSAPPRRKSIKTSLINDDPNLIRECINFELLRGGQVFIVHNRVNDIFEYADFIRNLVPNASIVVAHGQMNEKDLENKISGFFNGTYNILISTTIIESGIDIPNANTMIIDRADTFGLAQLHQLRGRIGRSDKKAYAYLIVPKILDQSSLAFKRLEILKKYTDIGTGFSLASADLEIRGAGDILGAEQSGHIEEIGLELYLQLLKEAIAEIKNQPIYHLFEVEIQTNIPSFIPKEYIRDSNIRLKYYKKLSNSSSFEDLEELKDELADIFGPTVKEVDNLFQTLKIRLLLKDLGVKQLKMNNKKIELFFHKSYLEQNDSLRNRIIEFFMSSKKLYQFRPDYSVFFNSDINPDLNTLFEIVLKIKKELIASK